MDGCSVSITKTNFNHNQNSYYSYHSCGRGDLIFNLGLLLSYKAPHTIYTSETVYLLSFIMILNFTCYGEDDCLSYLGYNQLLERILRAGFVRSLS